MRICCNHFHRNTRPLNFPLRKVFFHRRGRKKNGRPRAPEASETLIISFPLHFHSGKKAERTSHGKWFFLAGVCHGVAVFQLQGKRNVYDEMSANILATLDCHHGIKCFSMENKKFSATGMIWKM